MAEGWSPKPPLLKGTRVILFVVRESHDNFSDLMQASESTLEFWDNPIDDLGMERCLIGRDTLHHGCGRRQGREDTE